MADSDRVPPPTLPSSVARPRNLHARYHAHVYFDAGRTDQARQLCAQAAALFGVTMGRVHEKRVGPHPHWSCQLAFDRAQFEPLVAWLESHRDGLNILVHADTGNALQDHTLHASWLGEPSPLDLEMFRARDRADDAAPTAEPAGVSPTPDTQRSP